MSWWKEALLLAPNLGRLIAALLADPRVDARQKALLAAFAAYLASPVDLIPDFIPVLGHLDDLVVVLLLFDGVLNQLDADLVREHWKGSPETLASLRRWSARLSRFLPRTWKRQLFSG